MILHIDCNNFFVSCELVLHPESANRPAIVANNNESGGGIILALNKEAKSIGLKRGTPIFKAKEILAKYSVTIFQADHYRYEKFSEQVMQCVKDLDIVLDFTQYSIDEFFGNLPIDDTEELKDYVQKIKNHINESTGIAVSCGCAQTYTLAKMATHYAKKYAGYHGICIITTDKRERALSLLPIEDVWGIGHKTRDSMKFYGIGSALDFASCNESFVKRNYGTTGLNTWLELRGTPCIKLDRPKWQQSISQSRTFAYMTDDINVLIQEISNYASACATKLRAQNTVCKSVMVIINTNRHRNDLPQYNNKAVIKLSTPCNDSPNIIKAAITALNQIYLPKFQYKRAGVILSDISVNDAVQLNIFEAIYDGKQSKLMQTIDSINSKFGKEKIHLAIQGVKKQGKQK